MAKSDKGGPVDHFKEGRKLEKAADNFHSNRQIGALDHRASGHEGAAARYRQAAESYRKGGDENSAKSAEDNADHHDKIGGRLRSRDAEEKHTKNHEAYEKAHASHEALVKDPKSTGEQIRASLGEKDKAEARLASSAKMVRAAGGKTDVQKWAAEKAGSGGGGGDERERDDHGRFA